ncbi:transporter substrate-binding domain-containing protein [Mesorhizobium sp.]|uniref:transporter substrate-binding domain-containing protein n=1 Tax=Mesorhizobium sp. TaxID=1871066 RepID=UPI000FE2A54D|nr:transporter substrate-binding domain-containing protein [Mesorhizobium sp.]RWH72905.1 MAG: transporter substrate-binding domain-containing protein [Mesorhizobium sp.]RWL34209.1 MAG: transporter substrate-binding domain-containing protein [Mesorhizobium sp.]RWL35625.1 MAG: transporter substrate-binding domain-containing protein [Mesorhizobium sp.]RWL41035.1 MAG: transporter substrate-binding domain-containing protein [Mesorhizobium sp.]RWL52199.1 MAG: transporter substrate-binding domain-con
MRTMWKRSNLIKGLARPVVAAGLLSILHGAASSAEELSFATDRAWVPASFVNESGELAGFVHEIEEAIVAKAGWQVKFETPSFDAVIPGILSGKYAFGGTVDVTQERLKVLDIVPILSIGYTFITPKDSGVSLTSELSSICGLKIAIINSESTRASLDKQSAQCETDGKKPLTILTFPDAPSAQFAVLGKRADLTTIVNSQANYLLENDKRWILTGPVFDRAETGVAVKKGSKFGAKFAEALGATIADGSYQKILAKWGVSSSAVEKAVVNSSN